MDEADVKQRVIEGAGELFVRYGVRSITMDDIAHRLGISKKTLYQHFADKDDLVASAMSAFISKRCVEMEGIRTSITDAIEELVLMSVRLKESIRRTNSSMLYDIQKYHQKAWATWTEYRNKYIRQYLIRNIKEGIKQGYYREDINPEITATIRLELIQIGFDESVFPKEAFSTRDVQVQLLEHFAHGILTSKGKKLYDKYKAGMPPEAND